MAEVGQRRGLRIGPEASRLGPLPVKALVLTAAAYFLAPSLRRLSMWTGVEAHRMGTRCHGVIVPLLPPPQGKAAETSHATQESRSRHASAICPYSKLSLLQLTHPGLRVDKENTEFNGCCGESWRDGGFHPQLHREAITWERVLIKPCRV